MPLNPSSHLLHIGSNPYCTTYFREPQSKFGEPQSKTKAFLYSQGGDHLYNCLYGTWTRNLQLQLVTSCHLLNTVLSYTLFLTTYFWWPNNICIFFWYWAYNNKIPTLKKQTKPNKLYTPFVSFHYLGWPSHASISAVSHSAAVGTLDTKWPASLSSRLIQSKLSSPKVSPTWASVLCFVMIRIKTDRLPRVARFTQQWTGTPDFLFCKCFYENELLNGVQTVILCSTPVTFLVLMWSGERVWLQFLLKQNFLSNM